MLVKWKNEEHSIKIPDIDEQHQELFMVINQLYEVRIEGGSLSDKLKILKRLYTYTNYHFLSEERLFLEHSYPQTKAHIATHNEFRNKIKELLQDIREKPNTDLAPMQDYLIEWVINHIMGADKVYSDYFTENGIIPDIHISSKNRADAMVLWEKKQLALGIAEIDKQHKELINILQLANDLNFASDERVYTFIPEIIKKMFYYSQYHFSYEEEYMAKQSYPDLKEHQNWHGTFIAETKSFADKYNAGKSTDIVNEIVFFLKDWTLNHILTEDKSFKDYLIVKKK